VGPIDSKLTVKALRVNGCNAAYPVGDGHTLNSRSRPHSGRCGADEIATPAAGIKVLLT